MAEKVNLGLAFLEFGFIALSRFQCRITGQFILALSVKWNKQVLHFVVNRDENGQYYFETHKVYVANVFSE
ncbi:unnamed protein product [Gongylonema pulchrum]|uniref:SH2 domain-containing protein n=1 Tax=Gongylonema pulchrum TaxID=637853 RepID=A0A183EZJ6_9BILA|nr:unnamed protein product [Gongylonema pulchrum]